MNCQEIRRHWYLFHDSEGDAELHHQINDHLAMCPQCARWFYHQSRLEDGLAQRLSQGEANPALWERIRRECGAQERLVAGRWRLAGVVLAAASLLLAIVGVFWWGSRPDEARPADLATLSVTLHQNLASGREAVKLRSRSHGEIEAYLQRQVSFAVRCPPRDDAGFQVEGGGVCHFRTDPVAYVVGEVDGRPVSVFIMPRESLVKYPAERRSLERQDTLRQRQDELDIVIGTFDRNLVLVVGPLDQQQLLRVLKAYGSYQEHDAA